MALPVGVTVYGAQNTGTRETYPAGGTQIATMVVRLFANFRKYLEPDETPFSSSVKTGKSVNQKRVEFGIGFLSPHTVTLGATLASGAGTTALTLVTGDGAKLQKTDVLRITTGTTVEHLWVRSTSANGAVVDRAMAGTTAAQHTLVAAPNSQIIEILGPAAQENVDSPMSPIVKGALEYNLPQLFDYAIQVSNRADKTPDYEFDGASRYDEYLSRVMTSANIDFEKTSIMGKRSEELGGMTPDTAGYTPSLMGGLDFFTDRAYDLLGSALTETHLRTMQRDMWNAVGSNAADAAIMGGFMREAVSSLWNANRYATVSDKETTLVWNSVETEYGKLRFTISRYIPAGSMYFINLSDISIRPYAGGEWADVQLPTSGPYKKGRFTGDYTMTFEANAARAKIVNASTVAADYPNLA